MMREKIPFTALLFPAQAGMIPQSSQRNPALRTFPRASGDDPGSIVYDETTQYFSPRKRG